MDSASFVSIGEWGTRLRGNSTSYSFEELLKTPWSSDVLWKLTFVILSACLHFALFCFNYAPSKRYPDPDVQIQRADYIVSLFHASVTTLFTLYLRYHEFFHLDVYSFFNHHGSQLFQFHSCYLVGYMIYDIQTVTLYEKTRSYVLVVHHLAAIIGASFGIQGYFAPLISINYLGELAVVFFDIQRLAEFAGLTGIVKCFQPLACFTWFLCRLCVVPYVVINKFFQYQRDFHIPRFGTFCLLFVIFISLTAMNVYWLYKMVRRMLRSNTHKTKRA